MKGRQGWWAGVVGVGGGRWDVVLGGGGRWWLVVTGGVGCWAVVSSGWWWAVVAGIGGGWWVVGSGGGGWQLFSEWIANTLVGTVNATVWADSEEEVVMGLNISLTHQDLSSKIRAAYLFPWETSSQTQQRAVEVAWGSRYKFHVSDKIHSLQIHVKGVWARGIWGAGAANSSVLVFPLGPLWCLQAHSSACPHIARSAYIGPVTSSSFTNTH